MGGDDPGLMLNGLRLSRVYVLQDRQTGEDDQEYMLNEYESTCRLPDGGAENLARNHACVCAGQTYGAIDLLLISLSMTNRKMFYT